VKKVFPQLALSIFLTATSIAQAIHSPINSRYIQLGAYSKKFLDVFSFVSNQANLSSLKQASIGVYSEQRFSLKELNISTLAATIPVKSGGLGFQATYFGLSDYNESQLGIAYAKKLSSMVDIGVQFNYYALRIAGYGSYNTINFEIGTIFHPTEKVHLGFHVYNPIGGKLGKNSTEKLASIYKTGIGYEASEQIFLSAEIVKEENKPVNINAGLQYVFAKQLFARMGIATESASPYAGAGLHWKNLRLDIAVSYHPQLGFSPGLMLIYYFKNGIE
jgi:hypothetical protein